jgi:HEAT repeats
VLSPPGGILVLVTLVEMLLAGDGLDSAVYEAAEACDPLECAAVLALAGHDDPEIRRRMVSMLPFLPPTEPPAPEVIDVAVRLSTDPDKRVRDWACFVLAEQWREITAAAVLDALAARLDDIDRDTRSEALVGLAYRRDPRARPRVQEALTRPSGDVWRLEMRAAGALSDPGLHDLALRHRHGWPTPETQRTADIVCRLTDPAGPGDDIVEGVATLYKRRARGHPEGDSLSAWRLMGEMLDLAPFRAPEFLEMVLVRLNDDGAAKDELMTRSALAGLADDYGERGP